MGEMEDEDMQKAFWAALAVFGVASGPAMADDVWGKVEHGYVDNNGVKIHYAEIGEGPLVVMVHGFPDFWYSWRYQMAELSKDYKCVAIDNRGYNKSGQPEGDENYAMPLLVSDVAAVIKHFGEEKAIVAGHDWGGAIAWQVAINMPQIVDRLIICLPHPNGMSRELANNPEQQANSQYARNFQKENSHKMLSAEMLANFLSADDEDVKERYVDAFNNSSFKAMMAYYKQNYPREPYKEYSGSIPTIKMPVLLFHGLEDQALLADGLNNTWEWVEKDLTIVTVPGAGHWVQHDAADFVSAMMKSWLDAQLGQE